MSESFLSQEEVDALLEGVTGESQKTVEEAAESGEIRAYNISSQERIVRGRMPTMETVSYTHLDVYKRQHQGNATPKTTPFSFQGRHTWRIKPACS